MEGEGLVPSPEEEIKRKNAIEKLKQVSFQSQKFCFIFCWISRRYATVDSNLNFNEKIWLIWCFIFRRHVSFDSENDLTLRHSEDKCLEFALKSDFPL